MDAAAQYAKLLPGTVTLHTIVPVQSSATQLLIERPANALRNLWMMAQAPEFLPLT